MLRGRSPRKASGAGRAPNGRNRAACDGTTNAAARIDVNPVVVAVKYAGAQVALVWPSPSLVRGSWKGLGLAGPSIEVNQEAR